MKKIYVAAAAALLASTALTMPAFAADSTEKQIKMLQEQLRAMQQQLQTLQTQAQQSQAALDDEIAVREKKEKQAKEALMEAGGKSVFVNGEVKVIPPQNPKVVMSGSNKFTIQSADGAWSIAPTGRLHFDMGTYLSQKPQLATGPGTVAGGKYQGGFNVRRARLGFQGKAMGDFEWSLIADVGGTNDGAVITIPTALPATTASQTANGLINQAKIAYVGLKNTAIEAGYFASFMTLDEATSSNNIMFIERATPASIAGSVSAGDPRFNAGFRTWGKDWWLGVYFTGGAPGELHAGGWERRTGGYARATYNIVNEDLKTLHVGGNVSTTFHIPNTGVGTAPNIGLSDRAELRIDTTAFLNSGALGTVANPLKKINIYGAELAGTWSSFYFQGEYLWFQAKRAPGAVAAFNTRANVNFDGGYLQASYTFGGRRTYNAAEGVYGGVTPVENFSPKNGTLGAVEIAARISRMDLQDKFSPSFTAASQPGSVNGGIQTSYTVGINWIWNPLMMWKFNYIHTNIDKTNPAATATSLGVPAGIKLDAIAARFQIQY
jgi:phosphate-selective porin OprO/OprP